MTHEQIRRLYGEDKYRTFLRNEKERIGVGSRYLMSDGTIGVVTKKRSGADVYDITFYTGDRRLPQQALAIDGEIIRLRDAGFKCDLCAGATPSACHELEGEEESPDAAAADEAAARLALALDGEISRALGAKPPRG
jgi:hypothetical protein